MADGNNIFVYMGGDQVVPDGVTHAVIDPSVKIVPIRAFYNRQQLLNDVEFGKELESIECCSFYNCPSLQRIAVPFKDNLFRLDTDEGRYNQFDECYNLTTVDLVGVEGIHNTISSLLMESWKDETNGEIDRIHQELPNTPPNEKTDLIRGWIISVIDRMEHYKAEHNRLLKEHMTQLELAIWKAKLDEKDEYSSLFKVQTKRVKIDEQSAREEKRIMSGGDIIIKNVLPFLKLG
eukprot:scaffold4967_cov115-Skeletonema_menzelii.AAC.3